MNEEELLYDKIYERTIEFGRTHFIKEIMRLTRENTELKEENQSLKKKYENAVADYEYEHYKNQKAIGYINTFKITHNIDGDIAYLDEFHILASPKSLL